jgi:hypothetical protein
VNGRYDQTFVTALFDLGRREPRPKPFAFYREWASYVLGLDVPLVVFADPELAGWIADARAAVGLDDQTRVVPKPFEALAAVARLSTVADLPTFCNAQPAKDTPRYQTLNWAKVDLLEEIAASNPFGTDHVAWIDAAIGYVAEPPALLPAPSTPLAVLEMCATSPAEAADRRTFYAYERGRLAGGFLRAGRDVWPRVARAFRAELDAVIALGLRPNEQQVLSALSAREPDLFAPYPGDYAGILRNWDHVRRDFATVLLNIRHCRAAGLGGRALALSSRIAASIDVGALTISADDRAAWLDEYLAAALDAGDRPLAERVARDLVETCAESTYFRAARSRLLGQIARAVFPRG